MEVSQCDARSEFDLQEEVLRRDGIDNATNFAYLMNKNKSFARPSHAFFFFFVISVHFFPVLGKSASWNDHFSSFTEHVNLNFVTQL